MKFVLTIAGSDSCGGAGIQADIKTITSLGAHALTALTAVTAQNSLGIGAIHAIPAWFVSRQVESVLGDIRPHAVKIGMLATGANIREVARAITAHGISPTVVDPVLRSTTGRDLLEPEAISLLKGELLPLAGVVTPNLEEAGILAGQRVANLKEMEEAARIIKDLGPDVVITGGHLTGQCVDLFYDGRDLLPIAGSRIETGHTHGSGCVFSTALATFLAMDHPVGEAVKLAHDFTRRAIMNGYACGRGAGPVSPEPGFQGFPRQSK
jgi:hydroxymethylpyrimidine kinase/phosphomethylpyrimidine kinase